MHTAGNLPVMHENSVNHNEECRNRPRPPLNVAKTGGYRSDRGAITIAPTQFRSHCRKHCFATGGEGVAPLTRTNARKDPGGEIGGLRGGGRVAIAATACSIFLARYRPLGYLSSTFIPRFKLVMEIAITVTTVPSQDKLLLDIAAALQRDFNGALEFRWLAQGEAMDLILYADPPLEGAERDGRDGVPSPLVGESQDEGEIPHVKQMVAGTVADAPVDWCVQRTADRRKRMLIADMDSTTIGQESIDEMAEVKGIRPEVAAMTERSMRGELEFESGLRERVRLLRGMTEADLQRVLRRLTLNPGARTLVQTMKAHGAHTVLVSGGFTFFTSAIAEQAGFAANRGNALLWDDGRLAGAAEPIQGREAKLAALNEEAAAHGILSADVIAVGDGANDLAMLKAAGLSVAYRAKPIVAAEADAQVRYTDLTALLYFQGYTRDSFAS